MATWWRGQTGAAPVAAAVPLLGGAGGGGRSGGAGGLCGEGVLHRLLEERLQVSMGAWGLGIWRDWRSRGRVRRVALLAEGVEQNLPLPGLVKYILYPWHEVLYAAGQLGITHIA